MSGVSGAGAPPLGGVVRNSALSFVASAQPAATADSIPGNSQEMDREQLAQADRLVPAGLTALCEACSRLYPDQPNPLQVTTRLKYWLGGHDPLDYISMYWNPGRPDEHILPHWHYVSFGLSDLHGDGRVHPLPELARDAPSGYGFELTMRLSAEEGLTQPPLWPAALLQALARYVFTTGNKLCAGDHITWHRALDGGASRSRLRHLLVAADTMLPPAHTPHGAVHFLQIVGCTGRELKAAQRGSGFEVLKLISEDPNCGGAWLVTRMSRRASCRRVRAPRRRASDSRDTDPAPLAGVSATLRWLPWTPSGEEVSPAPLPASVEQQIKDTLQRGLSTMTDRSGPEGHMSTDSFEMSSMERALPHIPELMEGSWRGESDVEYLDGVHIMLNPEGASLLPLAIDGRIRLGAHFTWRGRGAALTLLPARGHGSRPYSATNTWLQAEIPKDLAADMSKQVATFSKLADTDSESDSDEDTQGLEPPMLPITLTWPKHKLKISVVHDNEFL
ncbi:suppressor of fused homolog [Helicoverpa zea]|uniref:suppressor of fused homolog n=1 Tax=Helicoverpa zea TaxID=7113 RepID=UPI001F5834C8|nr:suppressor of fused homolog [Helicoverpa zea]